MRLRLIPVEIPVVDTRPYGYDRFDSRPLRACNDVLKAPLLGIGVQVCVRVDKSHGHRAGFSQPPTLAASFRNDYAEKPPAM
jgi:hypothetical protein